MMLTVLYNRPLRQAMETLGIRHHHRPETLIAALDRLVEHFEITPAQAARLSRLG